MSKITSKFALAASVALALAFTLSCSSDDGDNGSWNWDGTFSSSVTLSSSSLSSGGSSSSVGSSSSFGGSSSSSVGNGTCSTGFKTVEIGTQTWMAENLNCDVEGSKCFNDLQSNCTEYGRLYDWATAMGLGSNCNSAFCSSQIQSKHRGICPEGWHLPSQAEWLVMTTHIGGADTEGKKLKATSGWNDYSNISGSGSGNGTDDYGFSALPGGWGNCVSSVGSFDHVGYRGFWWSTGEGNSSAEFAYYRGIHYSSDAASWVYNPKSCLVSVRCVKD